MFARTNRARCATYRNTNRAAFVTRRQEASQVGRFATSLRRSGVVTFHHEHSATVLSSQLNSDSIASRRIGPPTHPNSRLAEKCELTMSSVIATYLTIAAMLALTTFPVLVPALITAVHAIIRRTPRAPAPPATNPRCPAVSPPPRPRNTCPQNPMDRPGRSIGFFSVEPRHRTSDRRATRVLRRAGLPQWHCRSPGPASLRRGPRDTSPS